MEELNEMCDLSFESQPMQPEKECYSACIVYVEKSLKGMNLEELKKGDKLFNSSESLSDPCLNRPLVIRESLVVGGYAETAVLLTPNNKGILSTEGAADAEMIWKVVKVYTMPDGQAAVKVQRIK